MITFGLFDQPDGTLLADYTYKVQMLQWSTNHRGDAECSFFVPLGLYESFQWFATSTLHLEIASHGKPVYAGRVTGIALGDGGVTYTAVGYSSLFGDVPYTALWSTTDVSPWQILTTTEISNANGDMYNLDQNDRLFWSLKKNAAYTNGADYGIWAFQIPSQSSRQIVGLEFAYSHNLPNNWQLLVQTRNSSWTGASNIITITFGGVAGAAAAHLAFTAADSLTLVLQNNTGSTYTYTGEDGDNYLRLTGIRVVTSTANRMSTVVNGGTGSGSSASFATNAAGTWKMYVGQRQTISGSTSEQALVESITAEVTGTWVSTSNSYTTADTIQSHRTTTSEVVNHILSTVGATNAGLSTDTSGIYETGLDLTDADYADVDAADLLDQLAALGDTPIQYLNVYTYPPDYSTKNIIGDAFSRWYWSVGPDRRLVFDRVNPGAGTDGAGYFSGRSFARRTWYVDVSTLDLERTLETLVNSAYAVYQTAAGKVKRTATATDRQSVTRYGMTRRTAVAVDTTNIGVATNLRDTAVIDGKDPPPRSSLTFDRVFDGTGQQGYLWQVRANDTIVIRNLPPSLGSVVDRIRSFRIARTVYNAMTNTLTVEPEIPPPSLEFMLGRQALKT